MSLLNVPQDCGPTVPALHRPPSCRPPCRVPGACLQCPLHEALLVSLGWHHFHWHRHCHWLRQHASWSPAQLCFHEVGRCLPLAPLVLPLAPLLFLQELAALAGVASTAQRLRHWLGAHCRPSPATFEESRQCHGSRSQVPMKDAKGVMVLEVGPEGHCQKHQVFSSPQVSTAAQVALSSGETGAGGPWMVPSASPLPPQRANCDLPQHPSPEINLFWNLQRPHPCPH
mmetsp:Transcript_64103/g.114363  ORF Transcript_64103/g.114363 Transcript_64103/m.114363 type:complete len:228 (-) Transcript_64103:137-820(-)